MTKLEIIDAIRQFNSTAKAEFLANFCEQELLEYLEHLQAVIDPPPRERELQSALVA
jgi:hypothetical protein